MTGPPLGNLFRMLAYACDLNLPAVAQPGGTESLCGFDDVLSRLLLQQSGEVLRKSRYPCFTSEVRTQCAPVGRPLFDSSISKGLLATRRLDCEMEVVAFPSPVATEIHRACSCLVARGLVSGRNLRGLQALRLVTAGSASPINRHSLQQQLRVSRDFAALGLINLCRLIRHMCIPNTDSVTGRDVSTTADFDAVAHHQIFEAFVRGFFRAHKAPGWRVHRKGKGYKWRRLVASPDSRALVPSLRPDAIVESPRCVLIADAKYSSAPLKGRGGVEQLKSRDLYQLFAYLRNWRTGGEPRDVAGLLVYANVDEVFDHTFTIQDHRVRVASVDLQAPWDAVESRMKDLLAHGDGHARPMRVVVRDMKDGNSKLQGFSEEDQPS
jgi:5-methylcytosine-specific restriction enzyme subunit McrC